MLVKSDDISRVFIKSSKKNYARPILHEKESLRSVETINILKDLWISRN